MMMGLAVAVLRLSTIIIVCDMFKRKRKLYHNGAITK